TMSRIFSIIFSSCLFFFFSSRRRHTRSKRDWSSDVCSSDLQQHQQDVDQWRDVDVGAEPLAAAGGPHRHGSALSLLLRERLLLRSEERRVGKECRSRWSA